MDLTGREEGVSLSESRELEADGHMIEGAEHGLHPSPDEESRGRGS